MLVRGCWLVSLCQMAVVSARIGWRTRAKTRAGLRPPWPFEIELGFERLVDRLDDLAEWFEESLAWTIARSATDPRVNWKNTSGGDDGVRTHDPRVANAVL